MFQEMTRTRHNSNSEVTLMSLCNEHEHSGSKCNLLARIKLSWNSFKLCGYLSTCQEALYKSYSVNLKLYQILLAPQYMS